MWLDNKLVGTTANDTWLLLLDHVLSRGFMVYPREKKTLELLNVVTQFPMRKPIVTIKARDLGYRFMFAEAMWILLGDDRVSTIKPYSKQIAQFSDDGVTFFGAYGPKVREQMAYVIGALMRDQNTRQAVISIWRESPPPSRDIPCTLSVQWLIREDLLHCFVTMRSSDIWLGWPYDNFNFTMMSAYLLLAIGAFYPKLKLGNIVFTLGSGHLYDKDWVSARVCLDPAQRTDYKFRYGHLDPRAEWKTPADLVLHLKYVAENRHDLLKSQWCCCIARGDHNKKEEKS